jgi:hypothetical protein
MSVFFQNLPNLGSGEVEHENDRHDWRNELGIVD